MEKKVTRELQFLCPWEHFSVAAVCIGSTQRRVMSPLAASCIGETQTFPSLQKKNTLIPSQCWSLPVSALSISYPQCL